MATLQELRAERVEKLDKLRKLGVNPYPAVANRQHEIGALLEDFSEGEAVAITGRIWASRGHGKLRFFDVRDESGEIQLLVRADELAELDAENSQLGFEQLKLLDIGDFIEVSGATISTKTGQPSVEVKSLRLLTKSLRPLPDSWSGLKDKETRLRRRYLDTNVNQDVHDRFVRRSKFWTATREFLNKQQFLEINIPVLEHTTGGADAKPFVTHMDALDQDFYLRISHELPLKRLIGGGYEKVYDIGPRFRNEDITDEHLPEHIGLEWYWAYADWQDGMKFVEEMFRYVANEVWGTTAFTHDDHSFDLADEWQQLDYARAIRDRFDIDIYDTSLEQVQQLLKDNAIETTKTDNLPRMIDKLWKTIRAEVRGPAWLINIPKFLSPLAKSSPDAPQVVQRFQPVFGGSEMGNGFSELNDPQEQLARFVEQTELRDKGDDEAMMLDIDYVEMLEYGMPPTCGWGHSERVFWVLEGVSAREGVPFPQLRSELDATTRDIYADIV